MVIVNISYFKVCIGHNLKINIVLFTFGNSNIVMLFQFTASIQYAALVTVLVMGIFAFGNVPGLQVYVVQKAERYTPNAVDVASGLNIAAFNIGIAIGSIVGGQTVEHFVLTQTPWIGAVIVLVAFLLIGLSGRLDKPSRVALG